MSHNEQTEPSAFDVSAKVLTLDQDLRDQFEERAAFMEYLGGMPRAEAERWALADVLKIAMFVLAEKDHADE